MLTYTVARLESVSCVSPTFQTSTQRGEKRVYNDDFVFKVGRDYQTVDDDITDMFEQTAAGQSSIKLWGVVYASDVQPRVVANFEQEFTCHQTSKVRVLTIELLCILTVD